MLKYYCFILSLICLFPVYASENDLYQDLDNFEVSAEDWVKRCRANIIGFEPCSRHNFLDNWNDLLKFSDLTPDNLPDKLKCKDIDLVDKKFVYPSNCGLFEGGYVKDVSIRLKESGWLWNKKYTFEEIDFKILVNYDSYKKIVNVLDNLKEFRLAKPSNKSFKCERRNIYHGSLYEMRRPGFKTATPEAPKKGKPLKDMTIEEMYDEYALNKSDYDPLPGRVCFAGGVFLDENSNSIGQLAIYHYQVGEFENTEIYFYLQNRQ